MPEHKTTTATDTPIADAAEKAVEDAGGDPGTALAVSFGKAVDELLEPHTINVIDWVSALVGAGEIETETTEASIMGILAQILSARTPDEALASLELDRAREMCGDAPGGHSPLLEIRAARPMKSSYDVGAPTYAIVDAIYVHNGEPVRFTSGALAVQAVLCAMIGNGWMPFRAVLTIRRTPTTAGFYPMNLEAGG